MKTCFGSLYQLIWYKQSDNGSGNTRSKLSHYYFKLNTEFVFLTGNLGICKIHTGAEVLRMDADPQYDEHMLNQDFKTSGSVNVYNRTRSIQVPESNMSK